MSSRSPSLGNVPICIDARMLAPVGTGVTSYAHALRQAIAVLTERPMLLAATHEDDGRARRLAGALAHHIVLSPAAEGFVARDLFRRAHVHFTLYRRVLTVVPPVARGVMHWTYPVPIVMRGWANVYTVHDAIPLTRPDLSPVNSRRHRAVLAALDDVATRFVTVSQAARQEIAAATGIAAQRIVDAGQAIDATPPPDAPLPNGLVVGGYFLFCGAVEPRKNLARLIAAHRQSATALPLVIVGPDGWRADAIVASPGVIRLGFQDRATVRRLIAGARALLFPTLAEGFGLPVAEAMALGTAVLSSRGGALEEVAGAAALLVDPTDTSAMAAAIGRLTSDDALVRDLEIAGRVRAAAFTPQRFAGRLAAIYRGVLEDRFASQAL